MTSYTVEAITTNQIEASSPREAARKCYKEGGLPTWVNDNNIVGFDEETGDPIFDSDKYTNDEDGVYLMVKPNKKLGK